MKNILLVVASIICMGIFPANTFAQKPTTKEGGVFVITKDEYENLLITAEKYDKLRTQKVTDKNEQDNKHESLLARIVELERKDKELELKKKNQPVKPKKVELVPDGPVKGDSWQWTPAGAKRTSSVFDDVKSKPAKVYPKNKEVEIFDMKPVDWDSVRKNKSRKQLLADKKEYESIIKSFSKELKNTNKLLETESRSSTPEQAVKHYQLKRDERNDKWVADLYTPGLWWYGYYSPCGEFVARFYRLTPMSDLSSLMPHNYQYYQKRQPQADVNYLGSICGRVPR